MSAPQFNHQISGTVHAVGDTLTYPFSTYLGHFVKVFDPIVEGRAEAMGQASSPTREIVKRTILTPILIAVMVPALLFALIGLALKISSSLDKKEFAVSQDPNTAPLRQFKAGEGHRLISWNLAGMPSIIRAHNNTRPVNIRMQEAVEYIKAKKPEFCAFQEVFTDEASAILHKGLNGILPYSAHHAGKNILGLNSGLVIMSAYPLDGAPVYQSFEGQTGLNVFAKKGCLGVTLDLGDNKRAVIVNTHLEAGGGVRKQVDKSLLPAEYRDKDKSVLNKQEKKLLSSAKFNKAKQLSQVEALRQTLVDKAKAKDHEVVFSCIMGDTNIRHNLEEFNQPILGEVKKTIQGIFSRSIPPLAEPSGSSVLARPHRILAKENMNNPDVQKIKQEGRDISRVDVTEVHDDSKVTNLIQQIGRDANDTSDHWPLVSSFDVEN